MAARDADFQLYEDSGDGYAYEHGARATVHLHWDDSRRVLSIGTRSGAFPGMPIKNTFRIVLVKQGHGTGVGSDSGLIALSPMTVIQRRSLWANELSA